MKEIKNVTITATPATFKKESGEVVDYTQYVLIIGGKKALIKGANATGRVRLSDAFENVKDN